MKKLLTTSLIISSMVLAPTLKADTVGSDATEVEIENVQTTDEGFPVSTSTTNESKKSARKKKWQNICLAVGAVVVAVTALFLVSTNEGHKAD